MTRNVAVACFKATHDHRISRPLSLGSAVSLKGQGKLFWARLEFHVHWPFKLLFMKGAGYLCSFPAFGITQLSPSGSGKKKTLKITVLPTPLQRLRHTAAFTYTDLLSTPRRNFSSSNRSHLVMHKQRQQLTHLHSPGEWAGIVLFLGTLATTARPAGLWAPSLSPYLSCF